MLASTETTSLSGTAAASRSSSPAVPSKNLLSSASSSFSTSAASSALPPYYTAWCDAFVAVDFEQITLPLLFSSEETYRNYYGTMRRLHSRKVSDWERINVHYTRARKCFRDGQFVDCVASLQNACYIRRDIFVANDYQVGAAYEHAAWAAIHLALMRMAETKGGTDAALSGSEDDENNDDSTSDTAEKSEGGEGEASTRKKKDNQDAYESSDDARRRNNLDTRNPNEIPRLFAMANDLIRHCAASSRRGGTPTTIMTSANAAHKNNKSTTSSFAARGRLGGGIVLTHRNKTDIAAVVAAAAAAGSDGNSNANRITFPNRTLLEFALFHNYANYWVRMRRWRAAKQYTSLAEARYRSLFSKGMVRSDDVTPSLVCGASAMESYLACRSELVCLRSHYVPGSTTLDGAGSSKLFQKPSHSVAGVGGVGVSLDEADVEICGPPCVDGEHTKSEGSAADGSTNIPTVATHSTGPHDDLAAVTAARRFFTFFNQKTAEISAQLEASGAVGSEGATKTAATHVNAGLSSLANTTVRSPLCGAKSSLVSLTLARSMPLSAEPLICASLLPSVICGDTAAVAAALSRSEATMKHSSLTAIDNNHTRNNNITLPNTDITNSSASGIRSQQDIMSPQSVMIKGIFDWLSIIPRQAGEVPEGDVQVATESLVDEAALSVPFPLYLDQAHRVLLRGNDGRLFSTYLQNDLVFTLAKTEREQLVEEALNALRREKEAPQSGVSSSDSTTLMDSQPTHSQPPPVSSASASTSAPSQSSLSSLLDKISRSTSIMNTRAAIITKRAAERKGLLRLSVWSSPTGECPPPPSSPVVTTIDEGVAAGPFNSFSADNTFSNSGECAAAAATTGAASSSSPPQPPSPLEGTWCDVTISFFTARREASAPEHWSPIAHTIPFLYHYTAAVLAFAKRRQFELALAHLEVCAKIVLKASSFFSTNPPSSALSSPAACRTDEEKKEEEEEEGDDVNVYWWDKGVMVLRQKCLEGPSSNYLSRYKATQRAIYNPLESAKRRMMMAHVAAEKARRRRQLEEEVRRGRLLAEEGGDTSIVDAIDERTRRPVWAIAPSVAERTGIVPELSALSDAVSMRKKLQQRERGNTSSAAIAVDGVDGASSHPLSATRTCTRRDLPPVLVSLNEIAKKTVHASSSIGIRGASAAPSSSSLSLTASRLRREVTMRRDEDRDVGEDSEQLNHQEEQPDTASTELGAFGEEGRTDTDSANDIFSSVHSLLANKLVARLQKMLVPTANASINSDERGAKKEEKEKGVSSRHNEASIDIPAPSSGLYSDAGGCPPPPQTCTTANTVAIAPSSSEMNAVGEEEEGDTSKRMEAIRRSGGVGCEGSIGGGSLIELENLLRNARKVRQQQTKYLSVVQQQQQGTGVVHEGVNDLMVMLYGGSSARHPLAPPPALVHQHHNQEGGASAVANPSPLGIRVTMPSDSEENAASLSMFGSNPSRKPTGLFGGPAGGVRKPLARTLLLAGGEGSGVSAEKALSLSPSSPYRQHVDAAPLKAVGGSSSSPLPLPIPQRASPPLIHVSASGGGVVLARGGDGGVYANSLGLGAAGRPRISSSASYASSSSFSYLQQQQQQHRSGVSVSVSGKPLVAFLPSAVGNDAFRSSTKGATMVAGESPSTALSPSPSRGEERGSTAGLASGGLLPRIAVPSPSSPLPANGQFRVDNETRTIVGTKKFNLVPHIEGIAEKQRALRAMLPSIDFKQQRDLYRTVLAELAENETILKMRRDELQQRILQQETEKLRALAARRQGAVV